MTEIFNASLNLGQLPEDWKSANVTAIFKKGNRHVAGNYRPVSLTSIACNLLESIVREQMIKYMKTNKLFSKKQFGFLKKHSTEHAILDLKEFILGSLDKRKITAVLFLDMINIFKGYSQI